MGVYYQDDYVTLYHGDALDVMESLPEDSVDVVLTDPPYSSGTRREASRTLRAKSMVRSEREWFGTDSLTSNGFTWLMRAMALEAHRLLISGGHLFSFIDWRMYPFLSGAIESADLRPMSLIVWDKGQFGMGAHFRNQHELVAHFAKGDPGEAHRHDVGNVIREPADRLAPHPTSKPVPLLARLLSVVTPPGSTVLDPFAGSGSTLKAAKSIGSRAIGIEREERYCEVAATRLRQEVLGLVG